MVLDGPAAGRLEERRGAVDRGSRGRGRHGARRRREDRRRDRRRRPEREAEDGGERRDELRAAPVAPPRVLGEGPREDVVDPGREPADVRGHRLGRDAHVLVEDPEGRIRLERDATRQHLERDAGEGVLVGPRVERLPHRLLGGHVGRGPHHGPRRGETRDRVGAPGEAEVGEERPAPGIEEDVPRLDVAVEDPLRVGVVEGGRDRGEPGHRLRGRHRTLDPFLQRAPRDEGHDEVRDLLPLERRRPEIVDGEDVRVLEPGHETGLAEEALGKGRVGRDRVVDDLDGDRAVKGLVLGPPDFRHPAGPGAFEEAISTQEGSGGYGHGVLVSLP